MPNPFSIQPADFGQGMSELMEGTVGRAVQDKKEMLLQKAVQMMEGGDPNQLAAFAMQNPIILGELNEVMKMRTAESQIDLRAAQTAKAEREPELKPEKRTPASARLDLVDRLTKEKIAADMDPEEAELDSLEEVAATGRAKVTKIYSKRNDDGTVDTKKNIKPDSDQERQLTEAGFTQGTKTAGAKETAKERQYEKELAEVDSMSAEAIEDPDKFYASNKFKMNDDGTLWLDRINGTPLRLKSFYEAMGRRGNLKAMKAVGEQWDDSQELTELLMLPSVKKNLNAADREGLWDLTTAKWSNAIKKWKQNQGIAEDSPTATAIARIQRMASDERKLYMGVAVTEGEMKSALAWMPNAGDSYATMMNKTNLMAVEAEQSFRRWIDLFEKDDVYMYPWYEAFGIKRFESEEGTDSSEEVSDLSDPLGIR